MTDAKQKIEDFINEQPNWKKANLVLFRKLIHEMQEGVEEQWKWSVPVFAANGKQVVAMSVFKSHTKYNFFHGAKMTDADGLFNSGLDSKQHRSINLAEGDKIDEAKLKKLLKQAFETVN